MCKDFVKQANKIIFHFIWKGKDKVRRSTLVSEIKDGGLKATHLDSIIARNWQVTSRAAGKQFFSII